MNSDNTRQQLRIRRNIVDLQDAYEQGDKAPLENLMRAWQGIKALPASDPNSFFTIGGFHGEPFRGAGWGNASYWGGYCNHGNVLFPTWHRLYLLRLEDALRTIPGCEEVTLPFWDETSPASRTQGIPWALTAETFVLDGQTIANPLRSFVLNAAIVDHISGDDPNYSKPLGYETVRYPLSGLVGTPADQQQTAAHNAQFPSHAQRVQLLNDNIKNWLGSQIVVNGQTVPTNVAWKYQRCLQAPNYTVFSNTTSAAQWNGDLPTAAAPVVPLESPHNNIHLAVGGYDVPTGPNAGDFSPIPGANGDMGENDTAALDPIFYFHHCFIDYVFWRWQLLHDSTTNLQIIAHYPGTNSVDSQGATPGTVPNSWLTLDSPLEPFTRRDGSAATSRDCIHIENQLGYTYAAGSLDHIDAAMLRQSESETSGDSAVASVTGVSRADVPGSFLISLFANVDGEYKLIDSEAVLSRWHVEGCANCQTHLRASAFFQLDKRVFAGLQVQDLAARIVTRSEGERPYAASLVSGERPRPTFRLELRQ
ncbi:MAG: tyrosinase family protein [Cyanobacteriota bacterium]|nr:tyrosinase family protein [Cyanobacteriota bacterium]